MNAIQSWASLRQQKVRNDLRYERVNLPLFQARMVALGTWNIPGPVEALAAISV